MGRRGLKFHSKMAKTRALSGEVGPLRRRKCGAGRRIRHPARRRCREPVRAALGRRQLRRGGAGFDPARPDTASARRTASRTRLRSEPAGPMSDKPSGAPNGRRAASRPAARRTGPPGREGSGPCCGSRSRASSLSERRGADVRHGRAGSARRRCRGELAEPLAKTVADGLCLGSPGASVTAFEKANRSATPGTERRSEALDHRPVDRPGLAALDVAQGPVERREALRRHLDLVGPAETGLDPPDSAGARAARTSGASSRAKASAAQKSRGFSGRGARIRRRGAPRRPARRCRRPARNSRRCRRRAQDRGRSSRLTRPWVGRMPKRPQWLAGARTEPPVSVPSAKSHEPVRDRRRGAGGGAARDPVRRARRSPGVPKCAFLPFMEKASSSVMVLPTKRAPASSSRCTVGAVRVLIPDMARMWGEPPPSG